MQVHSPFARRQSELDHFRQAPTSGREKRELVGPGSVDGVLKRLSGLELEREQHEGASDERFGLGLVPHSHVTTAFIVTD